MNDADRQALAAELDTFATTAPDPRAADQLKSAGPAVRAGDLTAAADAVQGQLDVLNTADRGRYPRIAALAGDIKQPTGMQRFSSLWKAPFQDYAPSFLRNQAVGYSLSAVVGIALVGGIGWLVARALARRREPATEEARVGVD